ncbi:MAG: WD40 repeat domain-containing protein, partial [Bacteroidetes bacterium]|nr:WD40 repeat domain-containing protein [Bacteroidota bacterium]
MKAKYIIITLILFAITELTMSQDFGYEVIDYYSSKPTDEMDFFGDDVLLSNKWLPNENAGGLPSEIIYAPEVDKFYVYAGRNVIVINGTSNDIIKRIEVSKRGSVDWHGFPNYININEQFNEKRLSYNPYLQCIYCATEDEELIVIDCGTDSKVNTFKLNEIIENNIIDSYYNEITKKLFWIVSGNNNKAILTIIDGNTNTFIDELIFENLNIFKVSGNQTGDRLFMSCNNYISSTRYVSVLETTNYTEIDNVPTNTIVTDFAYNNSDKLYLAYNNAYLIGIIEYNQSTNDYQYLLDITTPNRNRLIVYNPVDNRIYASGGSDDGKINIIDGMNNLLITSINMSKPNAMVYNTVINAIFCAGSKLIKIYGNSNSINAECVANYGGESRGLAFKQSTGKILSVNTTAGHITVFDFNQPDPNIVLEDYVQTGGSTYYGCYNNINNKFYFIQNDSYSDKCFVNIYNANTNSLINSLVLEGATYVRTCTYDEFSNKVFITAYSSNKIYIVSGGDDYNFEIIADILTPMRIESIPNTGKLICGGGSMIRFIDAMNYSILETIVVPNQAFADFIVSEFDPNFIYVSCLTQSPYFSTILKINLNDYSTESLPLSFAAGQMVSDGLNLFVLTYNMSLNYDFYLGKISESSFTLTQSMQVMRGSYDLVFNPFTKKVYILHRDIPELGIVGGLTIVDGTNIYEIEIPGMHSPGMFLNPINNRIYFHTNYNPNSLEKELYLTSFDCTRESIESVVYLGQKHNYNESYYIMTFMSEEMVFNPKKNQLIFGNRGFSNISVIQCAWDKIGLNYGYRWLSFPRMERYGNDPFSSESVLENLNVYPAKAFTLYHGLYPDF